MIKVLFLLFTLCFTAHSSDESYSEIVFEDTPIGAIQSKLKRMKALWNKKNKKPQKTKSKINKIPTHQRSDLSKLVDNSKKPPKLKYKKYNSFQLDYATSYSDSSDKKLYFYGGYINSSDLGDSSHKKLRVFDYLTKSWTSVEVPYDYRVGASVTYFESKVYIYGGRPYKLGTSTDDNPNVRLNDLLIYDLTYKTWQKINIGTARSDHSATTYNGKIYFYGGDADPKLNQAMLPMEVFDTSNNTMSSSNYTSNRVFHRSLVHENTLYIVGGSVRSPEDYLIDVDTIEYIDLISGEKDTLSQEFCASHPIVGIVDDNLMVLGGYRGVRSDKTLAISLYSLQDEQWEHRKYAVDDLNIVIGGVTENKAYLFGSIAGVNSIFRLDLDKVLK